MVIFMTGKPSGEPTTGKTLPPKRKGTGNTDRNKKGGVGTQGTGSGQGGRIQTAFGRGRLGATREGKGILLLTYYYHQKWKKGEAIYGEESTGYPLDTKKMRNLLEAARMRKAASLPLGMFPLLFVSLLFQSSLDERPKDDMQGKEDINHTPYI